MSQLKVVIPDALHWKLKKVARLRATSMRALLTEWINQLSTKVGSEEPSVAVSVSNIRNQNQRRQQNNA